VETVIGRLAVWGAWASLAIVIFAFLPTAGPGDPIFVIPDYVWNPLVGVLQLDRYFPVGVFLAILVFDVGIRIGLFMVWIGSWIWRVLVN